MKPSSVFVSLKFILLLCTLTYCFFLFGWKLSVGTSNSDVIAHGTFLEGCCNKMGC